MLQKIRTAFLPAAVLLAVCATPLRANHIDSAKAKVTCTNYCLRVTASALVPGKSYVIDYTIILTPSKGATLTISDSLSFTAPSSGTFTGTVMKPLGPLTQNYVPSGTATLVGFNTIPIVFNTNCVMCAPPPPPPCTAISTNSSNFNGTPISEGYIWFNANFAASGIPSTGTTVTFTNSVITFSAAGTTYQLPVPNAKITFSPTATCSSTSFDSMTNTWMTIVPVTGDDEIFLSGLAFPVPAGGLPGGINPVSWEGTFGTDTSGISFNWKWGAAVYSSFTTDYNSLGIKAGHQTACGMNSGDHAGTPEGVNNSDVPWKQFVVGGARGGGGSNFTGSWSGTLSAVPVCQP